MPPQAELYRNRMTNEPFSDYVLDNVMLLAHLRRQAFQELHHEIMVAVHGNPTMQPCVPNLPKMRMT
jgi:hypothetical protein